MNSEHPDPELANYRPVNGWAVAALLLGVASPIAFADPLLWWVPPLGVLAAVIAMLRIGQSDMPMVGRKGAIIGLALSVSMSAAAPVHYFTHQYWLIARAEELAQKWFDDLQAGRSRQAYDLMLHATSHHIAPPHEGPRAAAEDAEKTPLQAFLERPAVAALLALGDHAHPVPVQTQIIPAERGRQSINLWYRVASPSGPSLRPLVVQIDTQRLVEPDGQERWLIQSVWQVP
jgi:hypothetical protein